MDMEAKFPKFMIKLKKSIIYIDLLIIYLLFVFKKWRKSDKSILQNFI